MVRDGGNAIYEKIGMFCLHEDAQMRENVLKDAVDLVNLKGYHREAQLGKEMEMRAVNIAGTEGPLPSYSFMTNLFGSLI